MKWLCELRPWDFHILVLSPNIELKSFVMLARKTKVFVYVLVIFLESIMESMNAKHLREMFDCTNISIFVEAMALKQSKLRN